MADSGRPSLKVSPNGLASFDIFPDLNELRRPVLADGEREIARAGLAGAVFTKWAAWYDTNSKSARPPNYKYLNDTNGIAAWTGKVALTVTSQRLCFVLFDEYRSALPGFTAKAIENIEKREFSGRAIVHGQVRFDWIRLLMLNAVPDKEMVQIRVIGADTSNNQAGKEQMLVPYILSFVIKLNTLDGEPLTADELMDRLHAEIGRDFENSGTNPRGTRFCENMEPRMPNGRTYILPTSTEEAPSWT